MRLQTTILIALILSVFLPGYAESNESRRWQASLTGGLYINNEQASIRLSYYTTQKVV